MLRISVKRHASPPSQSARRLTCFAMFTEDMSVLKQVGLMKTTLEDIDNDLFEKTKN